MDDPSREEMRLISSQHSLARRDLDLAPPMAQQQPTLVTIWVSWIKRRILAFALRRWFVMIPIVLITVGVVYGADKLLTHQSWHFTATMLYTPLPISQEDKTLFQPLNIDSFVQIAYSPEVLDELRRDFKLNDVPRRLLEVLEEIEANKQTRTLSFKFSWGDEKDGLAILNAHLIKTRDRVAQIRRLQLQGLVQDSRNQLNEATLNWQQAVKDRERFESKHNLYDAANDPQRLTEEITNLVGLSEKVKLEHTSTKAQLDRMDAYIEEMKRKQNEVAEQEKQFEAAAETVADNRRRQDRLRELIEDERVRLAVEAQMVAKQRELRRQKELLRTHSISDEVVEATEAEIETLKARIAKTEKIKTWEQELTRIDEVVIPKGAKKNMGSPIIQQALFKRLELELKTLGFERTLAKQQSELESKRTQRDQVAALARQSEGLLQAVQDADTARVAHQHKLLVFESLANTDTYELHVLTPATPATNPITSNRKIVVLMAFCLSGALLSSMAFGADLLLTPDKVSTLLRDRLPLDHWIDEGRGRQHAWHLRQRLRHAGDIALFVPVGNGNINAIVESIAVTLEGRDERVLLMSAWHDEHLVKADESIDGADHLRVGLSDYLAYQAEDLVEIVHPTQWHGIDRLDFGIEPMVSEGFATHRMRDLLETLRKKYSMLLVIGPRANAWVDLAMLAAHANGVFPVSTKNSRAPIHEIVQLAKLQSACSSFVAILETV